MLKKEYQAIICDIRMPEMNGKTFYREIHQKDEEVAKKITFTTGDTINITTRQFLDEIHAPYLSKNLS